MASICAPVSCTRVYHARRSELKSWRCVPSHQPASRDRFSGVPTYRTYSSNVMPVANRSGVITPTL
jgi:hypothetical protein